MTLIQEKNPSYLIKHRRKWQVKLTIPRDVRWAFGNKTTFKRSTGCDIVDIHGAITMRNKIVSKFKESVELHRSGMQNIAKERGVFIDKFTNRPYPEDYQGLSNNNYSIEKKSKSDVDGWIKERLLKKAKDTKVLRFDFWKTDKKIP